jgi:hypothetical protein
LIVMLGLPFANPAYLVAGAALISAPIIIHLINRMRFKRVRWAAMEFLLKAQKKSRRRLIIEQLILLMLRCLLVALTALLVLRYLDVGLDQLFGTQKDNLHIIVLDDTLSMNDRHKDADGREKTAFDVARKDIVVEGILKSISQSTTNDRLAVIPLSAVAADPAFQPKVHERLADKNRYDEAQAEVLGLKPSKLHVPLVKGVEKAHELAGGHTDKKVTIHVVSDFRKTDWTGTDAKPLHDALLKVARGKDGLKLYLKDAAHPFRDSAQGGSPVAHKNLAIVDIRPSLRVASRGQPVLFTLTVANYGREESEVQVKVFNETTGAEQLDATFKERMPLKVPAGELVTCSFDVPFSPELKENEVYHAHLSARLLNAEHQALEDDGLTEDNVRHVAVEIRNRVPILVVDGRGPDGRRKDGDSYFLEDALYSLEALQTVPGPKYEVIFGDKLAGGDAREALEAPDLSQYPTILLLNVPGLSRKQIDNLEKYVRQGGGVAFFMGPLVDAIHYNEQLYRDGKGVFPVPLEEKYFPPQGKPELDMKYDPNRDQLLLRDDQFAGKGEHVPVFHELFKKDPKLRGFMKHLPVRRYWPTLPPNEWKGEAGRVREILNLPNEKFVANTELSAEAINLVNRLPLDKDEFKEYKSNLKRHADDIIAAAGNPQVKCQQLAEIVRSLLTDRGDENKGLGNLESFWTRNADAEVNTLYKEFQSLRRRLLYSHPMMVTAPFGQGRVVAFMSTAGQEWNNWASGISGAVLYPSIQWKLQEYLASQSSETSLTVGAPLRLAVDRKRYGNRPLKVSRYLLKPPEGDKRDPVKVPLEIGQFKDTEAAPEAPAKAEGNGGKGDEGDKDKQPAEAATDTFTLRKALEPGLYVTYLRGESDDESAAPLFTWAHIFNVDTAKESKLARSSLDELESDVLRPAGDAINPPEGPGAGREEALINRPKDLSELPWFFLLFLGVLIAEQALAVHLSFHLKGSEAELPSQVVQPHSKVA